MSSIVQDTEPFGGQGKPAREMPVDTQGSTRLHLQQLAAMRVLAVAAQLVTVAFAEHVLGIDLPMAAIIGVLALLAAFNVWTWRRVCDPRAVSEGELLAQLCADILALGLVLGMTGGESNPFASLLLLPVAIGATFLSAARAWLLALASIACYTVLVFVAEPVELPGEPQQQHSLLAAALWLSYFVTAVVIAGMLLRIASALRAGEQAIAEARRKAAADENLLRIGAFAAGAAHELGAPLNSISLIVRELQSGQARESEVALSLETVSRQLGACRETLASLLSYGNNSFASKPDCVAFDRFVRECVDWFQRRRPDAGVRLDVQAGAAPRVAAGRDLRQALTSLLDNAADASPRGIEVDLRWGADEAYLFIRDHGPGFPPEVASGMGKLFFTTKGPGKGTGLGLYLANFVVMRCGGEIALHNAVAGGAEVRITLPATACAAPCRR